MIILSINGRQVELENGASLLDAARAAGVHVSTLCHYPGLPAYSVCRMCLVEVEGDQSPKPACSTLAKDGDIVQTDTEALQAFRKSNAQWLLARHPNDCMRCEVNGACQLQRLVSENQWEDHYTRKARKDRYPARSVYKLQEIQKKFNVIKKGDRVLDLGCAPGSWTLYAAELTGSGGRVVGIDLKAVDIQAPQHVKVVMGDALDELERVLESIGSGFDVVLSDMAPGTTGNKTVDAARSLGLCEAALNLAEHVLKEMVETDDPERLRLLQEALNEEVWSAGHAA